MYNTCGYNTLNYNHPFALNSGFGNSYISHPFMGQTAGFPFAQNTPYLLNCNLPQGLMNGQTIMLSNPFGQTLSGQFIIDAFGPKLLTPAGVYCIVYNANQPAWQLSNTFNTFGNMGCCATLIPQGSVGG